jgi:hypothetical protein
MARAGVVAGGCLFTAGVWLAVDVAGGLMTGGVLMTAYCLLLADVDPARGGGRGSP